MAQRRSWASYVIWGSIAVCAVLGAAFSIAVVVGTHRGIQFASPLKRTAPPVIERPQAKAPAPAASQHEIARLDNALRALAAERDRLAARVEHLEQSLGDITASIKDQRQSSPSSALPAAPTSAPAETSSGADSSPVSEKMADRSPVDTDSSAPRSAPAAAAQTRAAVQPAQPSGPDNPMDIFRPYAAVQPPVPPPAPTIAPMQIHAAPRKSDSTTTRTEFAIDLGAEKTMDGLRALWASVRGNHGAALDGLRPLVSIRDGDKSGSTELHLIAGPLVNAGAAARICAGLQAKGVTCQTTVFDGQRLAAR